MFDLGVIVSPPNTAGKWTDADLAAIFGRRVISRLMANELTPGQAFEQARLAGSYGLRALAHQETVAEGFNVIRSAFGGAK